MRVVSGKYKGRTIHPPHNFRARPTTDFAKESLFNILANAFDIESLRVLDLFSGTGSIAYEFASRGCADIELVESDRFHMAFIRKTITEWKIEGVTPHQMNVFSYLKYPRPPFDLIFCDPPFDMKGRELLPDTILQSGLLKPEGWLVFEHSRSVHFLKHPALLEERNYGSVHFSFFSPVKAGTAQE